MWPSNSIKRLFSVSLLFLVVALQVTSSETTMSVKEQNLQLLLNNIDQLLQRAETKIEQLEKLSSQQGTQLTELRTQVKQLQAELTTASGSLTTSVDLSAGLAKTLERLERESNSLYKYLQNLEFELLIWKIATVAGPVAVFILMSLFGGK